MADPFFSSVVLLCHFEGANGQTTTTDSSTSAKALTLSSSLVLDTGTKKFGTASLKTVSGGGAGLASTPNNADFQFGSGQFTVEGWFNFSTASGQNALISVIGAIGNWSWWLGMVNTGRLMFLWSSTGTDEPSVSAYWAPVIGTWYHIAADRDAANVVRLYVNGAVMASTTVTYAFFNSTEALVIGNDARAGTPMTGFIDEVRITKGVARYAGAFTPPVAAFPDTGNLPSPGAGTAAGGATALGVGGGPGVSPAKGAASGTATPIGVGRSNTAGPALGAANGAAVSLGVSARPVIKPPFLRMFSVGSGVLVPRTVVPIAPDRTGIARTGMTIWLLGPGTVPLYHFGAPFALLPINSGYVGIYQGGVFKLATLGFEHMPSAVTWDALGAVWAATTENDLYCIDVSGTVLSTAVITPYPGQQSGVPLGISALLWWSDNHLYAASSLNGLLIQVQ